PSGKPTAAHILSSASSRQSAASATREPPTTTPCSLFAEASAQSFSTSARVASARRRVNSIRSARSVSEDMGRSLGERPVRNQSSPPPSVCRFRAPPGACAGIYRGTRSTQLSGLSKAGWGNQATAFLQVTGQAIGESHDYEECP